MGMDSGAGDSSGGGQTMLARINVTPFVDVMLVLLVIFMVTAPMIDQAQREKRKVDMNLPVTKENPNEVDTEKTDKMILQISENLKVTIGDEVVVDCSDHKEGDDPARFESCFQTIEEKLGSNPKLEKDRTLFLLADTDIPYGFVVGTMARIKKAGVQKLGMVTNPEYTQAGGSEETKGE
jgi:biopolymer transport protein TolR